jgi:hypothetical protein
VAFDSPWEQLFEDDKETSQMFRNVTLLFVAAALAAGCQSPSSPNDPEDIDIVLTVNPAVAVATASSGVTYVKEKGTDGKPDVIDEYDWTSSFTINVVNNESIGAVITQVNVSPHQASGGILIPPSGGEVEYSKFAVRASGNRVEPNGGTVSVGIDVWYDFPIRSKEALVTVSISFKDDDDLVFTKSIDVRIGG